MNQKRARAVNNKKITQTKEIHFEAHLIAFSFSSK